MKKKFAIFINIIMIFVMCLGCGANKGTASIKNVKVLFSMSDASDPFRGILTTEAENYAKGNNINLKVMDAAGSVETQVSHMKEAASGGYNVIICAPVNPETALQLKKAAEGLPIIFLNSMPDEASLEKDKYIFVASNEEVAGKIQAEYVIDFYKGKKDLNVVVFKGEKNHSATNGRTKAVKQTFGENGINANYVFEDFADWSRTGAKDMFNIFLTTGKKYECVICNNDEMALGVIDAFKEKKLDLASIPILGIDATSDACKAISEGSMKLTVYQPGKGQSEKAVEAAVQLGSRGSISNIEGLTVDGKFIWVPFERVDKDNVSKYRS